MELDAYRQQAETVAVADEEHVQSRRPHSAMSPETLERVHQRREAMLAHEAVAQALA